MQLRSLRPRASAICAANHDDCGCPATTRACEHHDRPRDAAGWSRPANGRRSTGTWRRSRSRPSRSARCWLQSQRQGGVRSDGRPRRASGPGGDAGGCRSCPRTCAGCRLSRSRIRGSANRRRGRGGSPEACAGRRDGSSDAPGADQSRSRSSRESCASEAPACSQFRPSKGSTSTCSKPERSTQRRFTL